MLAPNRENLSRIVADWRLPRLARLVRVPLFTRLPRLPLPQVLTWSRINHVLGELAPKALYARALIIIIAPIVLLESVVAFAFMERHWNQVTRRLSEATARDVAAIVELYENYPFTDDYAQLISLSADKFRLALTIMPPGKLPTAQPKPFFDLLDRALSDEIRAHIKRPFWIDTVGQSRHVEIRVQLDQGVLRFRAQRGQTYASNSHIFPAVDGGRVGRVAHCRHPVPAQPDPADPAARGSR